MRRRWSVRRARAPCRAARRPRARRRGGAARGPAPSARRTPVDGESQRRDGGDVRLALRARTRRPRSARSLTPFAQPDREQLLERRHLRRVGGDDQLAGPRVRNVVLRAERVQPIAPLDAQPRLQRSGRIVDAGVNDAAVVGARLHPRAGMALEEADGLAGRRKLPRWRGRRRRRRRSRRRRLSRQSYSI